MQWIYNAQTHSVFLQAIFSNLEARHKTEHWLQCLAGTYCRWSIAACLYGCLFAFHRLFPSLSLVPRRFKLLLTLSIEFAEAQSHAFVGSSVYEKQTETIKDETKFISTTNWRGRHPVSSGGRVRSRGMGCVWGKLAVELENGKKSAHCAPLS